MKTSLEDKLELDILSPSTKPIGKSLSGLILHWSGLALVVTVWVSSTLFGLYILAFYAGALGDGTMEKWNGVLPRLHEPSTPIATIGIGLHFAAGGLILILGFIQLIESVRTRFPAFHRLIGRIYVIATLLAGIGGLTFIAVKGTIGGSMMDLGFSLYGFLMIVCAIQTIRLARLGQLEAHRSWALRLFALAIGSWLYRMDYGFWIMLTGGAGHTEDFRGYFDIIMAFFFYLPNLLVAEIFIRGRQTITSPVIRLISASILIGATGFLLLGTYYFTKIYWGPAIIERIVG